ncbi:hypothetical protein O5699_00895 [Escherichia coli]|nr:hypothetical protein [Escherichia coli]
MTKGNKLGGRIGECNYILALGAIAKINEIRAKHAHLQINTKGIAYVINSIKHPEEVYKLKRSIWPGIFIIWYFF